MASLRSNFGWLLSGRVLYAAAQWGVLICIVKLAGTAEMGRFSLALAIAGPVFVLSQLNLRAYLATDAAGEYRFRDYLHLRLMATGLALLVVSGVAGMGGTGYVPILTLLAVGILKAIENISDVFYGLFQRCERMRDVAMSLALRGGSLCAGMAAGLALTGSAWTGVTIASLAWLSVVLWHDAPRALRVHSAAEAEGPSRALRLAKACAPLGIVMMLVSLTASLPVYVLGAFYGDADVGYYAGMAYCLVLYRFLAGAMAQATAPRLARYHERGNVRDLQALLHKLMLLGGGVGVGGVLLSWVFGEPVLQVLYGPDFAPYATAFTWMMAAGGAECVSTFLGAAFTATRRFAAMVVVNGIATAAIGLLSFLLVPAYGVLGACWACAGAFALKLLINLGCNYAQLLRPPLRVARQHAGGEP